MKIPVITYYSFDPEVVVKLCDSDEEAQKYLMETSQEEFRIDKEENECSTEFFYDHDWEYAHIINHFPDGDAITTFTIGRCI